MQWTFEIPGTLPSLNDYIRAERANRFAAAGLKKKAQAAIVEAMGRTRGAVSTRLAERGLRVKRRSGGWTDEEVETLIRLRGEGLTARQVGEALGRTRDAVAFREKALRAAGVEVPRPRPLKETHGTVNCYGAGCRCPECKAAAAAHWQQRKKRLRRKESA